MPKNTHLITEIERERDRDREREREREGERGGREREREREREICIVHINVYTKIHRNIPLGTPRTIILKTPNNK